MIHPTIGRVVLVIRRDVRGKDLSNQPEPALVCYVYDDRMINVGGFNQYGTPFSATSLQLLQDDDLIPETGSYAEWMPYQKDQAAQKLG